MKETPNIPKLRFPEFEEEWRYQQMGNLLEFKNGINANKEQYGTGVKFINVLDILENDFITYNRIIGNVDVEPRIIDKYSVSYGDILFQRSSETREEVGTACVYLDKNKTAVFGGFVIRGKKVGDYNPIFFNKLLKTKIARKEITSRSGGSTRYNVGQDILSNVKLPFPTLPEQQKIATFLSAVDDKIQQLTKKKSLLEQYKKGVMQKIFKQEIRFKDKDGKEFPEWKEKKLGELCNITTGKLDANAMVKNGKYRFYTCAKEFYWIDKYDFDFEALLISGNGANVGYIHYYKGKFNAYQRTYILYNIKESYHFIKCYLDKNLQRRIHIEKKDGNTPYIVMDTLTDMLINLPSIKEQQKIASFLTAIDNKIEQVNTQLDKTIAFKKGLLQQMFV